MLNHKTFTIILITFFSLFFNFNLSAQYSISGRVYFTDNNAPVTNEYVYILELSNSSIIPIDSARLNSNGTYDIITSQHDTVLACTGWVKHNDPEDHVTTYYPSTIDWQQAYKIYPPDNPTNINIGVARIVPSNSHLSLTGTITTLNNNSQSVPVQGAIVIAKQSSSYINFALTDSSGNYMIDSINSGTVTIVAEKIGYSVDSSVISVTGNIVSPNRIMLKKVRFENAFVNNAQKFVLLQNYPNPFNPSTKIRFSLPYPSKGGELSLDIYDVLGKKVASLIPSLWGGQEGLAAGTYSVDFDGSNLSSGTYFYELTVNNFHDTKKMTLIK